MDDTYVATILLKSPAANEIFMKFCERVKYMCDVGNTYYSVVRVNSNLFNKIKIKTISNISYLRMSNLTP